MRRTCSPLCSPLFVHLQSLKAPELKERLEESEKLIQEMTVTWEEKLRKTEEIAQVMHAAALVYRPYVRQKTAVLTPGTSQSGRERTSCSDLASDIMDAG